MTEYYLPDEIVQHIIMWKNIKDTKIIAEQTLADMLAAKCHYDAAVTMLRERNLQYEQIYSIKSMYARNDAINICDAAKKLCKITETAHNEATVAFVKARTGITL